MPPPERQAAPDGSPRGDIAATTDRVPGLRDCKKARTRHTIRAHALRLFTDKGYDATTVEDILTAAEVSETTLYRYFPTTKDLVLNDDLDTKFIAALEAHPADLSAISAVPDLRKPGGWGALMMIMRVCPAGCARSGGERSPARPVPSAMRHFGLLCDRPRTFAFPDTAACGKAQGHGLRAPRASGDLCPGRRAHRGGLCAASRLRRRVQRRGYVRPVGRVRVLHGAGSLDPACAVPYRCGEPRHRSDRGSD